MVGFQMDRCDSLYVERQTKSQPKSNIYITTRCPYQSTDNKLAVPAQRTAANSCLALGHNSLLLYPVKCAFLCAYFTLMKTNQYIDNNRCIPINTYRNMKLSIIAHWISINIAICNSIERKPIITP